MACSALPLDLWETGERIPPAKLLAGNAAINKAVVANGSHRLAAEICLEATPSTRPKVTRLRGSGARALDRHALRALASLRRPTANNTSQSVRATT